MRVGATPSTILFHEGFFSINVLLLKSVFAAPTTTFHVVVFTSMCVCCEAAQVCSDVVFMKPHLCCALRRLLQPPAIIGPAVGGVAIVSD